MTPKHVIFDVGGTLVDSQAHIVQAMDAVLERVGAICLNWGYHSLEQLHAAGAVCVLDSLEGVDVALDALWRRPA